MTTRRLALPAPRVFLLAALAFGLYGGIAAWVNWEHGTPAALRALVVQGTSSALATFFTSYLIDVTVAAMIRARRSARASLLLGAASGTMLCLMQHTSAHLLAATPNLLATIAAPSLAGLIYSSIYAGVAVRREAAAVEPPQGA
jgi:hypothetical protein